MMTRLTASVCMGIIAAMAGCVTDGPKRGPKSSQPKNVVPTQIVTSIGPFDDTDGNGYPDSATISLYVFADAYPEASVMIPATLTFRLRAKDGSTIREWAFTEDRTASLVRRGPVGLGYVVRLSLLDTQGGDTIAETRGDLSVTYKSSAGVTLASVPEAVRIGRSNRPQ